MQINISNLSEGTYSYNFLEDPKNLAIEEVFQGPVAVSVTLEKSLNHLLLSVRASVKGIFICDRCADDFEETIETAFSSVYSWENDETAEEDDDYHIIAHDQNMIDISESVKEYLTIAVPLKHLCRRASCEIPLREAHNEDAIDPRWEKLKELKKQQRQ
ncbi:MAG: DUF177 domain-containing protein [Bacteroidota bacterium]|jgi:uncharacterized metal-binding protein YceD (DUF177 family)